MKETYCKLCGYVGAAGETSCPDCGAPLFVREASKEATAESVDINREPKKRKTHPRLRLAAGFLAVCLLAQGAGLWLAHRPGPKSWSYVPSYDNGLVTPQGIWRTEDDVLYDTGVTVGPRRVLSGAYTSDPDGAVTRCVYYYDGQTMKATDWADASLSPDGQVLFYLTGKFPSELLYGASGVRGADSGSGQTLMRRDLKTGREQEIARGPGLMLSTISYRGDACVYFVINDAATVSDMSLQIFLWQASTGASRELEEVEYPMTLGRNGDNGLYYSSGLSNGGDDWSYRVTWGRRDAHTDFDKNHLTDRDLTQLLYQNDQGVWCYEDEDGTAATLYDLPRNNALWVVTGLYDEASSYRYGYGADPQRLTDMLYGASNGRIYYLSDDLTVTDLTGPGQVDNVQFFPQTGDLYYRKTNTRMVGGTLYRMKNALSGRRETVQVLDSDDVRSYAVSPDGSVVCVRVWEGAPENKVLWKISVDGGAFETLECMNATQGVVYGQEVLPMNDGGCWYLGTNTGLRRELWYRSPEGEEQLKLAYTSPASSTLWLDQMTGEVELSSFPSVIDVGLVDVSDGDQALFWVNRSESVSLANADMTYWLLEADGTIKELEVLTP